MTTRRAILTVGLASILGTALAACGLHTPDYSGLDADLKRGIAGIPGVTVERAWWSASGMSQAVVIDLVLATPTMAEAKRVGRAVLAVAAPLTKRPPATRGDGTFCLVLLSPTGTVVARASDVGIPDSITAIREQA